MNLRKSLLLPNFLKSYECNNNSLAAVEILSNVYTLIEYRKRPTFKQKPKSPAPQSNNVDESGDEFRSNEFSRVSKALECAYGNPNESMSRERGQIGRAHV